jgi:tripartite-type tricarboxylate transporter receptor subunit TctC
MRRFLWLTALLLTAVTGLAQAQAFPVKPVRMIVPYPAGGPTDQLGRIYAEHMARGLGQPVVVENRGGANTQIGTAEVTKAAPDGYTLLFGGITPFVFNPLMYSKLQYDPADLTGVAMAARSQLVLVAKPALPVKSVAELVVLMKASPGKLNFGSAGNGNVLHLAAELFLRTTETRATHVPFSGTAPALISLLGGNIDFMFDVIITSRPHIQSGKLTALATSGARRSPIFPDVPTVAESGYPSYESATWFAIAVPKGTPPTVVQRLNAEAAKAARDPAVVARLESMAMEPPQDTSSGEVAAQTEKDLKRWGALIRGLGIRLD